MTAVLDPQAKQVQVILESLSGEEEQLFLHTLSRFAQEQSDSKGNAVAEAIAGRRFSRKEQIQLEIDTVLRHFAHRRELLATSLTAPQVAQLLGTSRQTPHDRLASQTLLAIKDNGAFRFPLWQFDPAGSDGILEGLPEVLKALSMSDYAKLNWLTRNNPYLEGQTPLQLLKQGQKEVVLREAADAGAGQWS